MKRTVMVSGAGRSGTSTVAGSLQLLGLHIPQPEVPADESNPRGFFETQWVVDFHKRLLDRSPVVRTIDARPQAAEHASRHALIEETVEELTAWLAAQEPCDQILVKDPRAFWFHGLWRRSVQARGGELSFITMLRHPVEVAKSRDTYYVSDREELFRRRRAVANVAAWCNVSLVCEEVTRGDRRTFVRYTDLLTDWRAALAPVTDRLELEINADLASGEHHAVDDFIDSDLRRSQTSWDDYDMPADLVAIAEGVWEEMNRLVDDPDSAEAVRALTALQADYGRLHEHAVGIALDYANVREVYGRRSARGNTRREFEQRMAGLVRPSLARRAYRYARRRLKSTPPPLETLPVAEALPAGLDPEAAPSTGENDIPRTEEIVLPGERHAGPPPPA